MLIRSLWIGVAGVLLAVVIPIGGSHAQDSRDLVESKESLYNNIYVYRQGPYYSMTFGYNRTIYTESVYNTLDDRDLPVEYTRYMTASLMYARTSTRSLKSGSAADGQPGI